MPLDLTLIRQQFPSLDRPAAFFDNPGGTQIVRQSVERINKYLLESNANHEGAFETSQKSDAVLDEAHRAMADFYNASSPDEIIFGNNMTTLTLHLSRSISREWKEGDEIVVTRLDHDANVTPWVLAAQDRGVKVNWVDFDVEDGTLKLDNLQKALERKPRLLAVGYASNALGTINPVEKIIKMAHDAGARGRPARRIPGRMHVTLHALMLDALAESVDNLRAGGADTGDVLIRRAEIVARGQERVSLRIRKYGVQVHDGGIGVMAIVQTGRGQAQALLRVGHVH